MSEREREKIYTRSERKIKRKKDKYRWEISFQQQRMEK